MRIHDIDVVEISYTGFRRYPNLGDVSLARDGCSRLLMAPDGKSMVSECEWVVFRLLLAKAV